MDHIFDTLFTNADIITVCDEMPVIKGGYVGVKDGIIKVVSEGTPKSHSAKEVVDCHGGILMPGLINTHTHTAMSLMRGYADDYALQEWLHEKIFPLEAKLDARCVTLGAKLGFAEMLRSGTTSISDMYFFQPQVASIVGEVGIRASLSNGLMSFDKANFSYETDRATQETLELINSWHKMANDRIRADVSIHAEYTSYPSIWRYVAKLAKDHDLTLHVHVSETKREHEECVKKYGLTPVQVLDREGVFDNTALLAHCVWLTESDMAVLAERKANVAHNPVSNLKLASGIADIVAMKRFGVNVSLGTDGACSNNTYDMFEEMKLSVLLQKAKYSSATVLTAYDAIKMATVNGAKAQGRYGQVGQIKKGLAADIILIIGEALNLYPNFDPISAVVYGANGKDVALTMVDGKILYRDGEFMTIDTEAVKHGIAEYVMKKLF